MPNIIMHTIFADEIIEELGLKLDDKQKQLFEIGANGPDFLFFHGMNPAHFVNDGTIRKLGSMAHSEKINLFYEMSLKCLEKEKDECIQNQMKAYISGHLCHWALDSIVHPYVFYRTGNCKGESSWWHHRFESLLDAIVLKVKREQTIQDYKVSQICDLSLEQARSIVRFYVPIAKNVYHMDIKPHQIWQSLQDWHAIQNILYDASGNKYKMISNIEHIFHKENALSGLIVPNYPDDPFDVCNLLHKEWVHPCDDTITSTESIFDLYDRAIERARQVIELYMDALHTQDYSHLLVFLDNQNYDLGISERKEMKYFHLIY